MCNQPNSKKEPLFNKVRTIGNAFQDKEDAGVTPQIPRLQFPFSIQNNYLFKIISHVHEF